MPDQTDFIPQAAAGTKNVISTAGSQAPAFSNITAQATRRPQNFWLTSKTIIADDQRTTLPMTYSKATHNVFPSANSPTNSTIFLLRVSSRLTVVMRHRKA